MKPHQFTPHPHQTISSLHQPSLTLLTVVIIICSQTLEFRRYLVSNGPSMHSLFLCHDTRTSNNSLLSAHCPSIRRVNRERVMCVCVWRSTRDGGRRRWNTISHTDRARGENSMLSRSPAHSLTQSFHAAAAIAASSLGTPVHVRPFPPHLISFVLAAPAPSCLA